MPDLLHKLNNILTSETRVSEIVRFALTGSVATAVQYLSYLLLVRPAGVSPELSTMISYCISFTLNFILSNIFTFHTHPNRHRAIGFAVCHAANLTMQTGLVALLKHYVSVELALLPAVAICVPINYLTVRMALKKHL